MYFYHYSKEGNVKPTTVYTVQCLIHIVTLVNLKVATTIMTS